MDEAYPSGVEVLLNPYSVQGIHEEGTLMNEKEKKLAAAFSLKNEDGSLQIHKDAYNHLVATALHIKRELEEGRDPVELMNEIHDTSCYWLMNDEVVALDADLEADIKRKLN